MSIDAYTGWPGSGKSHTVVDNVILPALRAHLGKDGTAPRVVVTNIPMKREAIDAEMPGCDLREFDVAAFEKLSRAVSTAGERDRPRLEQELRAALDAALPLGCVWVLDEVWRLWPSGQKPAAVPEPFKAILAEHRHRVDEWDRSMQIALVTQDLAQVGKFARDLVEQTYRTEKLSVLGLHKRYRVDVYRGGVTGARPSKSLLVRQTGGKYNPKVFQFYHSHTKSEGGGNGADERKVDKRGSAWRSPWLWLAGPVGVVACIYGSVSTWNYFHPEPRVKPLPAVARPALPSDRAVTASVSRAARTAGAAVWNIVASFEGGGLDAVYLQSGRRLVRLSLRGHCDKDLEGYLVCTYEGVRVSNRERVLPAEASSPSLASVLPFSSSAGGSNP